MLMLQQCNQPGQVRCHNGALVVHAWRSASYCAATLRMPFARGYQLRSAGGQARSHPGSLKQRYGGWPVYFLVRLVGLTGRQRADDGP